MSYLDDPDHTWELSKIVEEEPRTATDLLIELANRSAVENHFSESLEIILLGATELKKRHPEYTLEACLDTSMIWYYG